METTKVSLFAVVHPAIYRDIEEEACLGKMHMFPRREHHELESLQE
ncbi:hypothetical protein [Rothia aeria]|nr:hypothetical protein [Rothia aeria]